MGGAQQVNGLGARDGSLRAGADQSRAMAPRAREELGTASVQTRPLITLEQLHEHRKPDDCWIAIDGKVYDLSKWAIRHPGGEHLLHNMAGEDATGVYKAFHTPHGTGFKADKLLKYLPHVADLVTPPPSPLQVALNALHEQIDRDGLYNTRPSFYIGLGAWLALLLASALYLTVTATGVGSTVLSAAVFALFLQQCAFVGHDAAHNGITHNRNTDIMIGMVVGPLLTGISTAWWKRSHNAHHVVTNSVSHDPDIQHIPFFAITPALFKKGGVWSFYHRRFFHFDAAAKFLLSYQHYLYYPVMCFARWNLYVQGWLLLLDLKTKTDFRVFEIGCLLTFWSWLAYVVSLGDAGIYECMYVCMYVRMYVCMHVCTYMYTYHTYIHHA